ncbi:MAG: signal peptidase II [Clostridiales bacterium]|nr:signal peptidase II [Clostridiales bacterium]MDY6116399.1 signal peptidase II [Anaerovoracaceae bacterium]
MKKTTSKLSSRTNYIFAIGLILVILLVDFYTKYIVRNDVRFIKGVPLIPNLLNLIYVKNEGAAFSMLSGYRIALIIISSLAIILGIYAITRLYRNNKIIILAVSMVIAGGIGNLIDRIFFGFVTDMISLSFFPPVFNVADISVTLGCIILIIYIIAFDSSNERP